MTFYSFNNHEGLKRVLEWDKRIHGHNKPCRRSAWCLATALALVNNTQLPPPPNEGKTGRPWRSASIRLQTIKQLLTDDQ